MLNEQDEEQLRMQREHMEQVQIIDAQVKQYRRLESESSAQLEVERQARAMWRSSSEEKTQELGRMEELLRCDVLDLIVFRNRYLFCRLVEVVRNQKLQLQQK